MPSKYQRREARFRNRRKFRSVADLAPGEREALMAEAEMLHRIGLGYKRIGAQLRLRPEVIGRWRRAGWNAASAARQLNREDRSLDLVEMYQEGLSYREIGERMGGWSVSQVSTEISRLRREGYALPYRARGAGPNLPVVVA